MFTCSTLEPGSLHSPGRAGCGLQGGGKAVLPGPRYFCLYIYNVYSQHLGSFGDEGTVCLLSWAWHSPITSSAAHRLLALATPVWLVWGVPLWLLFHFTLKTSLLWGITANSHPFPHWCAIEVKGDLEVPAGTAWTNCVLFLRGRGKC